MKNLFAITATCAGIMGLVGGAQADTVYTSRAAFDAATAGQTIIDFNGIAGANSYVAYNAGPLILSGVTFTGNGSMFVIGENWYGTAYPDGAISTRTMRRRTPSSRRCRGRPPSASTSAACSARR